MLPSSLASLQCSLRACRHDDARKHRRELPGEGEGDDSADHPLRGELSEADDDADREGHPSEEAYETDDEGRARADEIEGNEDLGPPVRRADQPRERLHHEEDGPPEVVEGLEALHLERSRRPKPGATADETATPGRPPPRSRPCSGLPVEARHATGDGGEHFPRDRARMLGNLVRRDDALPEASFLRAEHDHLLADGRQASPKKMSVTSTIAMSIDTAPTMGARRPAMRTLPRFDSCLERPSAYPMRESSRCATPRCRSERVCAVADGRPFGDITESDDLRPHTHHRP